ncbi:unnamed protein product, partial [marine sediment metagenome]
GAEFFRHLDVGDGQDPFGIDRNAPNGSYA